MKLALTETTWDRSLERRWDLSDAQPVLTHPLYPTVGFVPVDLRVWWQVSNGRWQESCRAHAWPAKDQDRDRTFASWDSVADWRGSPFVPVAVDISWSFYPDRPASQHRYSIYAHSAGRSDRSTAQWGGNPARHDPDLPAWIRELADAQYEELAATANASTAERTSA